MPLPKPPPPAEQRWKKNEARAKRCGLLKTVYETNGEKYTGEWKDDLREGKGTCITKSNTIYDGDWIAGNRQGFGVRSVIRKGKHAKEYSGGWVNNKKQGYGANFYANGDTFEGEWFEGMRSGWGRHAFANGDVYEGEWLEDECNGTGLLLLANGNRYEGEWLNHLKHGEGKFFYLDKGQLYIGTWIEGIPKCGEFIDLQRQNAEDPTQYPLPELGVKNPRDVLGEAAAAQYDAFEDKLDALGL